MFRVGPRVRRLLAGGATLDAVVSVRAVPNVSPIVRRITLSGV
jgi:hypothetical protein